MHTPRPPVAGSASQEVATAAAATASATATATTTASTSSTNVATTSVAAVEKTGEKANVAQKTCILKNASVFDPATGKVSGNQTIKLSDGVITEIKSSNGSSPYDMVVHVVDRLSYSGFTLIIMRALLRL
ncbi:hypothetical protein E4U55_007664 [Claviceps digitariae]|nr:hypothetical protein E4U55_007664 [Claviceps digitariae]